MLPLKSGVHTYGTWYLKCIFISYDDWKHILATCSDYNEIRDLDSMGIIYTRGLWGFSRALKDIRTIGGEEQNVSGGIPLHFNLCFKPKSLGKRKLDVA